MPVYLKPGEQFVTRQRLDQLVRKDLSKKRSRSAPTPNENAPAPCTPGTDWVATLEDMLAEVTRNAKRGDTVAIMAYLLFLNSMRVQELLAIRCDEISPFGTFRIHAGKGSVNRIGQSGEVAWYLINKRSSPKYLFDCWNTRTIYYQFRKRGYRKFLPGKSNASVTHLFRHAAVYLSKGINADKEAIQLQLGHRSKESQSYYAPE